MSINKVDDRGRTLWTIVLSLSVTRRPKFLSENTSFFCCQVPEFYNSKSTPTEEDQDWGVRRVRVETRKRDNVVECMGRRMRENKCRVSRKWWVESKESLEQGLMTVKLLETKYLSHRVSHTGPRNLLQ